MTRKRLSDLTDEVKKECKSLRLDSPGCLDEPPVGITLDDDPVPVGVNDDSKSVALDEISLLSESTELDFSTYPLTKPSNDLTNSCSRSKLAWKNAAYTTKCIRPDTNKPRTIKNLKQVITAERLYPTGVTSYGSIEMGSGSKPPKKYSDISGMVGRYVEPNSKVIYSNSAEFAHIRTLGPDQIAGYLALRRINMPIPQ